MINTAGFGKKVSVGVMGLLVVILLTVVIFNLGKRKVLAMEVESDGRIMLSDGRTINLSGIRLKSAGEDGYEKTMFVLTEMLISKEVVLEKGEDSGYFVWIGCTKRIIGYSGCNKRLLVNEVLVRAGVADRR